jgi:tRNA(Ile)-lysidine synthase
MDSMALLRDLRFRLRGVDRPRGAGDLLVAHVDHGMRPGSGADARWLAGVCRAWGLAFVSHRPTSTPRTEEEARVVRYAFLEAVRSDAGAVAILTAHHADDQAETVLFRILRGTGVAGLRGIPARRGVIHRPMLHLSRGQIETYVRRHGVPYRTDPTNELLSYTRNRIRHEVIPVLEARVSPGLRRSLVRLARNARRAEAEREALEGVAFGALIRSPHPGRREWPVEPVAGWPEALRRRLLRTAARELGVSISSASTAVGVEGMASLRPGQGVDLSGGLRLSRGPATWILVRNSAGVWEEVRLDRGESSQGGLRLGDRRFRYEWGPGPPGAVEEDPTATTLALPGDQAFRLRGWRRGDRIRMSYGSKPVAKLLAERGVAAEDRPCTPVLEGADGSVLWVPGAAVAEGRPACSGRETFLLRCVPESYV